MNQLKILHITPWFPNKNNPQHASFIVNHINSLQKFCHNEVLHLEINETGNGILPHVKLKSNIIQNLKVTSIEFTNFPKKWRIYELLCYWQINKFLSKNKNRYDIINFHIAYPNAVFIEKFIKKFPAFAFSITEQWSAYHIGFNLIKGSKGRNRIENIFTHNKNLFVVSSALGKDIQDFCSKEIPFEIIPNIVDTNSFKYSTKKKHIEYKISSINWWSKMKNPEILIMAFKIVNLKTPHSRLILGGDGYLLQNMKQLVKELELTDHVDFLGALNKEEVSRVLAESTVYCQSSNYETFSVICVEALCTGTPVVATNIGGMKDFITEENGVLVNSMDPNEWASALIRVIENIESYKMKDISNKIAIKYSSETIGKMFYEKIRKIK